MRQASYAAVHRCILHLRRASQRSAERGPAVAYTGGRKCNPCPGVQMIRSIVLSLLLVAFPLTGMAQSRHLRVSAVVMTRLSSMHEGIPAVSAATGHTMIAEVRMADGSTAASPSPSAPATAALPEGATGFASPSVAAGNAAPASLPDASAAMLQIESLAKPVEVLRGAGFVEFSISMVISANVAYRVMVTNGHPARVVTTTNAYGDTVKVGVDPVVVLYGTPGSASSRREVRYRVAAGTEIARAILAITLEASPVL